ncbi:MAG: DUF86 domain-containing protein [Thermodesulfobacteriota bacterium]
MKDDRVYLLHILECIEKITSYLGPEPEAAIREPKTQDAVLRNLQVLAESSQRLSPVAKQARPEIPWRAIAGLRNVLVHDYLSLNQARILAICQRDLPGLRQAVSALLAEAKA